MFLYFKTIHVVGLYISFLFHLKWSKMDSRWICGWTLLFAFIFTWGWTILLAFMYVSLLFDRTVLPAFSYIIVVLWTGSTPPASLLSVWVILHFFLLHIRIIYHIIFWPSKWTHVPKELFFSQYCENHDESSFRYKKSTYLYI